MDVLSLLIFLCYHLHNAFLAYSNAWSVNSMKADVQNALLVSFYYNYFMNVLMSVHMDT
jgi:hypothetical protein